MIIFSIFSAMASLSSVFIFAIVLCTANELCTALPMASQQKQLFEPGFSITASFGKNYGESATPEEKLKKVIPDSDIIMFVKEIAVKKLVKINVGGFKLVETKGVWNGGEEMSFDIVVLISNAEIMETLKVMEEICSQYKNMFNQDAVLLFHEKVKKKFI